MRCKRKKSKIFGQLKESENKTVRERAERKRGGEKEENRERVTEKEREREGKRLLSEMERE